MSLSWRDRVVVTLAPGRWSARRVAGLWPHRALPTVAGSVTPATDEPPWRAALVAAGAALAGPEWAQARREVILADALVRYRLLAWQPGLADEAEQRAYARLQFREVHGPAAEGWEIRIAAAPPGEPRLACAIDGALAAALPGLAGGRAPDSVRPAFVAAFDRLRGRLGGALAALALVDGPHLTLGVLSAGRWLTLASRHLAGEAGAELPAIVNREALRGGWPEGTGHGIVIGAAAPTAHGSPWRWQALDATEPAWA